MPETRDPAIHVPRTIELEIGKPVVLPLKAERIQLVLLALDREGDRGAEPAALDNTFDNTSEGSRGEGEARDAA